jgi:mannose-6-phosphate isomerase-like protein (cupin superfamily)
MAAGKGFDRVNLDEVALTAVRAHGGRGEIGFARIVEAAHVAGPLHFIDLAVVPPGSSIGSHRHRSDEEEFYLVLEGEGSMVRDGRPERVSAGDLLRNPPSGAHELHNTGSDPLRLFVFELAVVGNDTPSGPGAPGGRG